MSELKDKQTYLFTAIIQEGYDGSTFAEYLRAEREDGEDLDNWTMAELEKIVQTFKATHTKDGEQKLSEKKKERKPSPSPEENPDPSSPKTKPEGGEDKTNYEMKVELEASRIAEEFEDLAIRNNKERSPEVQSRLNELIDIVKQEKHQLTVNTISFSN